MQLSGFLISRVCVKTGLQLNLFRVECHVQRCKVHLYLLKIYLLVYNIFKKCLKLLTCRQYQKIPEISIKICHAVKSNDLVLKSVEKRQPVTLKFKGLVGIIVKW